MGRAAEHYPRVEVRSRADWRAWLAGNHASSAGVWAVTWKKTSDGPHVPAAEIAEEALCVGWVDSLPRAVDANRTSLLVTPRKPGSSRSRVNRERVERLRAAGPTRSETRARRVERRPDWRLRVCAPTSGTNPAPPTEGLRNRGCPHGHSHPADAGSHGWRRRSRTGE